MLAVPVSDKGTLTISPRDIVSLGPTCDVVVNSANPGLGGIGPDLPEGVGGIDGAIHRAAGIDLLNACLALPIIGHEPGFTGPLRCRPGELRTTPAFGVARVCIYHAVGPIFVNGRSGEWGLLQKLYENIFNAFARDKLKSIVLPPIGTRSYDIPRHPAAQIALLAAIDCATRVGGEVYFSVIDDEEREIYHRTLGMLVPE